MRTPRRPRARPGPNLGPPSAIPARDPARARRQRPQGWHLRLGVYEGPEGLGERVEHAAVETHLPSKPMNPMDQQARGRSGQRAVSEAQAMNHAS